MKKVSIGTRLLSVLLALVLVVGVLPASVLADAIAELAADEPVILIAGSDFQAKNTNGTSSGHAVGATNVTNILNAIRKDYPTADGFLFAGDYDNDSYNNSSETNLGIDTLMDTVDNFYTNINHDNSILIHGNHDYMDSLLDDSGENDTDDYGVFVIHENDYNWVDTSENYSRYEPIVEKTAANLTEYLDDKIEEGYTKPIFVISHLPLHYSMRTRQYGDGHYAKYLVDAMNDAGEAGLNIVFLYGHDHSHGWDDYLGGAAVYLEKGDKMLVANPDDSNRKTYTEETLNFTYMNPGYVGYYGAVNNGADTTLTMTVFEIYDDRLVVKRYDSNGQHLLKSAGVRNNHATTGKSVDGSCSSTHVTSGEEYDPNTKTVESGQTIKLVDGVTVQDTNNTGITVTAPDITGVTVEKQNVAVPEGYAAYVTYDIQVDGFEDGTMATVTIPVDTTVFNPNWPVQIIDQKLNKTVSKPIVNGTVTFTTDHFSLYTLAQAEVDESVVTNWIKIPGETTYTYTLDTNGVNTGTKYLIVNTNSGTGYALTNNNGTAGRTEVAITGSGTNRVITVTNDTNINWIFSSSSNGNVNNNGTYLRPGNGSLFGSSTNLTIDNRGSGQYRISRSSGNNTYYVKYTSNNWTGASGNSNSDVYLYALTGETSSVGGYAGMAGKTSYTLAPGAYEDQDEVLEMIQSYIKVYTATDANGTGQTEVDAEDYTITGTVDPTEAGEYILTVSYEGKALGTITVNVVKKVATSVVVNPTVGTVQYRSPASTVIGTLTVTYDDDTTETVDLTVDMLEGNYNLNKVGTYTGLSFTYAGYQISDYTLNVVGNDYPEYPDEGAVSVHKTATGIDFQSTGIAKVELSATGVPYSTGIDVILILDASSSMRYAANGATASNSNPSRASIMRNSLIRLFEQFNTPLPGGAQQDIRVAVGKFSTYYDLSSTDQLAGTGNFSDQDADHSEVLTDGLQGAVAGGFVDASVLAGYDTEAEMAAFFRGSDYSTSYTDSFGYIGLQSGTNYDSGMEMAYALGEQIREYNEDNNEDRELYVIFMSDGAPFQYNYYSGRSANSTSSGITNAERWNYWLTGNDDMVNQYNTVNGANTHFYNGDGTYNRHWTAEAIKGSPDANYAVIDKNSNENYNGLRYMKAVPGLGATMYSIAFCPADDQLIEADSMRHVLRGIATNESYYHEANNAEQLDKAFSAVSSAVLQAATNARFVDTMGNNFDLQLQTKNGVIPDITVQAYDIYTETDVNGDTVTKDMIGDRKGTSTILEKITFSADGKQAYSNGGTDNVLINGVITANTFWYNTTGAAVMIDADGDSANGAEYSLAPETFYWKMGTIGTTELALSYYVYLTGSIEGEKEAGSYATNESAILYYTNHLGNAAQRSTVSPVLAWESANVSYAFYLVNEDGEIIVNQTTGQTGSFANRVAITQPVVYEEILLNNTTQVQSIDIASTGVLPDGYRLYDETSAYEVTINSNSTGAWKITKDSAKADSTYVTQHTSGGAYSNALTEDNGSYDYTHTVVWFAVVWEIKTIPDSVVIDYGLPVDISVLINDMFGENGTLVGIGEFSAKPGGTYTATLANGFGNSWTGSFGSAALNDSKIRYTLNNDNGMQINTHEQFAYAVRYTSTTNSGYYYGTVTIIPATTIYYEDDFLTYAGSGTEWEEIGSSDANATQDEDRPGEFTLSDADANNVYGKDGAYNSLAVHSLGSAMKVHVGANSYATAAFTFYGTGFDVISMTSNTTGTLTVKVYEHGAEQVKANVVKSFAVDTYYGYTYADGEWAPAPDTANALYQVPVIQVEGLEYKCYDVVITATYASVFDHTSDDGYDLYLDAIRIYDPANDGADNEVIKDAYVDDGEGWPEYLELRNNVIKAGTFQNGTTTLANGFIFIDGQSGTVTMEDYTNYGPNNELYLLPEQSIAFKLNPSNADLLADIQLAAKSANGKKVTATIANYDDNGNRLGGETREFTSNTDMYNTIYDLRSGVIVISNVSSDANAILSLTNIKFTFKKDPNGTETQLDTADLLYMDTAAVTMTLRRMNYVPPFAPEEFEVNLTSKSVLVGTKAFVTVRTSKDVESISVNGKVVDICIDSRWTGMRTWIVAVEADEVGELAIETVAYNADGVASEATVNTVNVFEESDSCLGKVFGWIFG